MAYILLLLQGAFHFIASVFVSMYIAAIVSFLAAPMLNYIACKWSRNGNVWEETNKYVSILWLVVLVLSSSILMNFAPAGVSYLLVGVIIIVTLRYSSDPEEKQCKKGC